MSETIEKGYIMSKDMLRNLTGSWENPRPEKVGGMDCCFRRCASLDAGDVHVGCTGEMKIISKSTKGVGNVIQNGLLQNVYNGENI